MNRVLFLILYLSFMGLVGYHVYNKIVNGGPDFDFKVKTMGDMSDGNFKVSSP